MNVSWRLLILLLSSTISTTDGFYVSEADNITHKEYVGGFVANKVHFIRYKFYEKIISGSITTSCDELWAGVNDCDAVVTRSSCAIRPNCISEINKKIPPSNRKDFGCNKDDDNFQNAPFHWKDLAYCERYKYLGAENENEADIDVIFEFNLRYFYKWHYQTTTLYDNDYGVNPNDLYICNQELRSEIEFNFEYNEEQYSIVFFNFGYIRSIITLSSTFVCINGYHDPYCTFKCTDDHRKVCVPEYVFKDIKGYEKCNQGWYIIPYKMVLYLPSCLLLQEQLLRYDKFWVCAYRDKCSLNTKLCLGQGNYCVISGNDSHICAQPKLIFVSNLYPGMDNVSHLYVAPDENISCDLLKTNLHPAIHDTSSAKWHHFNNLTIPTPNKYKRAKKNSYMKITNQNVVFATPKGKFGYDYAMICKITLYGGYTVVDVLLNYTVLEVPSKIVVNMKYYIIYMEEISFQCNGFPKEMIYYDIKFNNDTLSNFSKLERVFIPENKYFGNLVLNITAKLDPPGYVNYSFWNASAHSVKVFRHFYWKDPGKLSYVYKESLFCEVSTLVSYKLKIIQMYGGTVIRNIDGPELVIEKFLPGPYKMVCVITMNNFNATFLTMKTFNVYSYITEICFLPFAPIKGMLVKCVSSHYPKKQGSFSMLLLQLPKREVILNKKLDWLRIPYVIIVNQPYAIRCTYTYYNDSKPMVIHHERDFTLKDTAKVPTLSMNDICMSYGEIPQEYDYFHDVADNIIFYNNIYYLFSVSDTNDSLCSILLLISFIFQFPVIPLQPWLRKWSRTEKKTNIEKNVEFMHKRVFIRKLNDKVNATIKLRKSHKDIMMENKDIYDHLFTFDSFMNKKDTNITMI